MASTYSFRGSQSVTSATAYDLNNLKAESLPASGLSDILIFPYPFDSAAVALWRRCVTTNGSFTHGMDPDFILPFLEIDEDAVRARLILSVVDGNCEAAVVVVPDKSALYPDRCWQLFSHDHIDVSGFARPQVGHNRDSIFDLASAGLAQEGKKLSRLMLPKMQYLDPGHLRSIRTGILHNAYFDFGAPVAYQVPTKMRNNNRRLRKKLIARHGSLRLDVAPANMENMSVFFEIEASGWKGAAMTAINNNIPLRRAYLAVSRHKHALSRAHVFTLFAGDKAVSSAFGLVHPEYVSLLKIGFRPEFAEYSPGGLLASEIIEYVRHSGRGKLYLSTFPVWAKRWKPESVEKECRRVYAEGATGLCLWLFDNCSRLPARVSRLVSASG